MRKPSPPPAAPRARPRREDGQETRTRLMHAAGAAFAKEGYRTASVRSICQQAGANLGAVRYYFGSKEGLYRETLFGSYNDLIEHRSMALEDYSGPPKKALRAFIRDFVVALMDRRRDHPYLPAIMMRELAQPTSVFDELVHDIFLPLRTTLATILARLLDEDADARSTHEHANYITLLCIQFALCRPLLERFPGKLPETREEIEAMAERIYTFARHGLRGARRKPRT